MECLKRAIFILSWTQVLCQSGREASPEVSPDRDKHDLMLSNLQFPIQLYRESVKEGGNVFFSPWSLQTALGMVYAGAGGNTKSEMRSALSFPPNDSLVYEGFCMKSIQDANSLDYGLHSASKVFVDEDISLDPIYQSTLEKIFASAVESVNFRNESEKIRDDINAWVQRQTNDKIRELVPQGTPQPDAVMFLVNAIYFEGTWLSQFKIWRTSPSDFHVSKDRSVQTDMMALEADVKLTRLDDLKLQAFELPYKGARLSMIVLLPEETDGLEELESGLTADAVTKVIESLEMHHVNLFFPKFKIERALPAKDLLVRLGMRDLFTPRANLSGITAQQDLLVSDVFHKAFVEVNEGGTVAAASTGLAFVLSSAYVPKETIVIRADHPFIFFIYDYETSQVLFMGRITDPQTDH